MFEHHRNNESYILGYISTYILIPVTKTPLLCEDYGLTRDKVIDFKKADID